MVDERELAGNRESVYGTTLPGRARQVLADSLGTSRWRPLGPRRLDLAGPYSTSWNASTTRGSNCVPAQRRSSASASGGVMATRYERSVVIASNASQTQTIRAPIGIAPPRS